MKGAIFNALQELVEEKFAYELWDEIIEGLQLDSEGIYTSTENYTDEELFAIVGQLSVKSNIALPDLIRVFGKFLFPKLMKNAPQQAKAATSLRAFLKMVDDLIHVEVKKLYQDANLPHFDYEDASNSLTLLYESPRKLCYLSEGLIEGAAEHFDEKISLTHPVCMHDGAKACHIVVTFND